MKKNWLTTLQGGWRAVVPFMPGQGLQRENAIFVDARAGWSIDSPVGSEMNRERGELRTIKEIELTRLELRYAHTRIERPEGVAALAGSIERFGQIIPVIVLRQEIHVVLLDGYLRVKALKALGRDMVIAEIWECKEEEALVELLARTRSRKWDLFEEAALLQELHDHYQLSQTRIASLVGRKQSWVSGRLALYRALSEDLIVLIRTGSISTWSATRVIVPIARALPEQGKMLTENLAKVALSTRQMATFFRHYQKANRKQRENMVREPALFLKSVRAQEEAHEARVLKGGPEGKWLRDLQVVTHMLRGLIREVPTLFYAGQTNLDRRLLLTAFEDSEHEFRELEKQIRRYDAYPGEPASDYEPVPAGSPPARDQPHPQMLPDHGPASDPGNVARKGATALSLRGTLIPCP
jgi:ParB family chromosome partitioning protein